MQQKDKTKQNKKTAATYNNIDGFQNIILSKSSQPDISCCVICIYDILSYANQSRVGWHHSLRCHINGTWDLRKQICHWEDPEESGGEGGGRGDRDGEYM